MIRHLMTVAGWHIRRCDVCGWTYKDGPRIPLDLPCMHCDPEGFRAAWTALLEGSNGH